MIPHYNIRKRNNNNPVIKRQNTYKLPLLAFLCYLGIISDVRCETFFPQNKYLFICYVCEFSNTSLNIVILDKMKLEMNCNFLYCCVYLHLNKKMKEKVNK